VGCAEQYEAHRYEGLQQTIVGAPALLTLVSTPYLCALVCRWGVQNLNKPSRPITRLLLYLLEMGKVELRRAAGSHSPSLSQRIKYEFHFMDYEYESLDSFQAGLFRARTPALKSYDLRRTA
jgi:hypothetical protein